MPPHYTTTLCLHTAPFITPLMNPYINAILPNPLIAPFNKNPLTYPSTHRSTLRLTSLPHPIRTVYINTVLIVSTNESSGFTRTLILRQPKVDWPLRSPGIRPWRLLVTTLDFVFSIALKNPMRSIFTSCIFISTDIGSLIPYKEKTVDT